MQKLAVKKKVLLVWNLNLTYTINNHSVITLQKLINKEFYKCTL